MQAVYRDPNITSLNRMPARARRAEEITLLKLHEGWRLRLFDRPEDCGEFYLPGADESEYRPVPVPGNWQLSGFEPPVYTNVPYPWPLDKEGGLDGRAEAFRLPDFNPTGCYRLKFSLPEKESGARYALRFEGVETAYELYVNGVFAGYAEDSKLASEFDITALISAGENLLALKVYSYASSSYLEDQDYWYLNGIHRPVYLLEEPEARIEDYKIEAVPDRYTAAAVFSADVAVSRVPGFSERRVRAKLYGPKGELVGETVSRAEADCDYDQLRRATKGSARIRIDLKTVERWTPENPVLYKVCFELLSAEGAVLDTETCPVGFKRVDIEDGILKINGKRVVIRGVNRHEFAWKYGRAVPEEHMIREILEMKRMNINAVRTCHYPDSPLWYDLCDRMGLLVLSECDLETHGVSGQISHDPNMAPVYTERAMRMVMQHKNHPCIYGWSLGNESGYGPGHAAMYGLIKEYDKTRICQYEAGNPPANISDIRGWMYASEKEILGMLADPKDSRPVILVEYLYQIRSSGGGMEKYIDLTQRYERFQGGFVWDWQDKSLLGVTEDGTEFFAHGGDFKERFLDPENPLFMTNNGLVRADLRWKPVAYDVREAYAPLLINTHTVDNAFLMARREPEFTVENRTLSETSDAYTVSYTLQDENGEALKKCDLSLEILLPGEKRSFSLKEDNEAMEKPPVFVLFEVTRRRDGENAARRQFRLKDVLPEALKEAEGPCPVLKETADAFILSGADFTCVVSKETGLPVKYTHNGVTKLTGAVLTTDRPYSGLDAEPGWGWRASMDAARRIEFKPLTSGAFTGTSAVTVVTKLSGEGILAEVRVTCDSSGKVRLDVDGLTTDGLILPRFGAEFILPAGFDNVSYKGYGPLENYSDRLVSAVYGKYSLSVDELGFDYAPPSENAGREGVRALSVFGDGGSIRISGIRPFHFDARHFTVEDMKKAMHTHELTKLPETILHLDAYHMPIGSDMAWSTGMDPRNVPGAALHTLRVTIY